MVYTETREINESKYYYRVLSVRRENKVSKKRVYLGVGLNKEELKRKEEEADKELLNKKSNREIEKIKAKITPILKKNKVTRAGIFGSYARGEQKKESDIDIVVNIEDKKMSLIGFIGLVRLLEEKLGRKVDLVEYSAIKPLLKESILKEEVKIL
ncbi:MAG: nucleotidyltransferase family protein [Candidatus Pacearchaeota archaeon]|nr:nucleotidyltransferase family protein [Candidatus Pacearchaeota archaeon]